MKAQDMDSIMTGATCLDSVHVMITNGKYIGAHVSSILWHQTVFYISQCAPDKTAVSSAPLCHGSDVVNRSRPDSGVSRLHEGRGTYLLHSILLHGKIILCDFSRILAPFGKPLARSVNL